MSLKMRIVFLVDNVEILNQYLLGLSLVCVVILLHEVSECA